MLLDNTLTFELSSNVIQKVQANMLEQTKQFCANTEVLCSTKINTFKGAQSKFMKEKLEEMSYLKDMVVAL